jgi:hypothetical protein
MVRFSASMAEAQMKCHHLVHEVVKNFRWHCMDSAGKQWLELRDFLLSQPVERKHHHSHHHSCYVHKQLQ